MYSISFLIFVLCSVPFIRCELARNDINISSPPIAGGIIPSKSIYLSTSTGTKLLPSSEKRKSQNVTLETPFLTVSVRNTTDGSTNEVADRITNALTDLVDKSNQDLLPGPEQMINPEDIMLDLDIPVRLTELQDLAKVSSPEQFKQKFLRSSLLEELFEDIESKEKYYSALKNLASGLRVKRSKRELNIDNEAIFNHMLTKQQGNSNGVVHKIFYHYPKRTNSDFVYKPETSRMKIRRNANSEVIFNPSTSSELVGVIHHHLPRIPPHVPIRAPFIPHHPVHRLPHLAPPPPLPIIPPAVLAQIIRARARHPLPPLLPIGLLPQIARSIGILPWQILPSVDSYPDENIIIARGNTILPHLRNIIPTQPIGQIHSTPSGYPLLPQPRLPPSYSIQPQSLPQYPFRYSSRFNGPTFEPVHRPVMFLQQPRSIFENIPPFRRYGNNNQQQSLLQFVPYGNLPNQQSIRNLQHTPPSLHFTRPYNGPRVNHVIHHQPLVPMPMTYTRIPRTIQINNADSQEVLESLEHTGALFGNALFSLIGQMPTITR